MSKTLESFLLLIGIIVILQFGQGFLIPLVLGLFFGFFFLSLGKKITRSYDKPSLRTFVAIGTLMIFLLLLALAFTELGSYIHTHWGSFTNSLASAYNEGKSSLLQTDIVQSGLINPDIINNASETLSNSLSISSFDNVIGSTLGGILNFILVIVYAVLTIVYRDKLAVAAEILLPKMKKEPLSIISEAVYEYIKGLLILVCILAVIYYLGLLIVGSPYALFIAIGSALMTLVPTVGTMVGAVLAVIATGLLTGSILKALFILAWYFGFQQIEEYFILPNVVGKKVQLNVLTTITSIVFWGLLRGVAGIFLAIPIMGVLKNILSESGNKWNQVMAV